MLTKGLFKSGDEHDPEGCEDCECYEMRYAVDDTNKQKKLTAAKALLDCLINDNCEMQVTTKLKSWLKDLSDALGTAVIPIDCQKINGVWDDRPLILTEAEAENVEPNPFPVIPLPNPVGPPPIIPAKDGDNNGEDETNHKEQNDETLKAAPPRLMLIISPCLKDLINIIAQAIMEESYDYGDCCKPIVINPK